MNQNNFKLELYKMSDKVSTFTNDRDLERFVSARLDKSLEFYIKEIERCCDYLIDKSLIYQIRRLNSVQYGG